MLKATRQVRGITRTQSALSGLKPLLTSATSTGVSNTYTTTPISDTEPQGKTHRPSLYQCLRKGVEWSYQDPLGPSPASVHHARAAERAGLPGLPPRARLPRCAVLRPFWAISGTRSQAEKLADTRGARYRQYCSFREHFPSLKAILPGHKLPDKE